MRRTRNRGTLSVWARMLLVVSTGCSSAEMLSARLGDESANRVFVAEAQSDGAVNKGFMSGQPSPEVAKNASIGEPDPTPRPEENRMRIYRARIDLLVGSVNDALKSFVAAVETSGGYLENRDNGSVTVRVPVARFWSTLEGLKAMGTVLSESQSAEDVTRQYTDLELRIQTADTSRTRLLALLEKAQDTKALLEIENEVRRLTEEIESMRAQLKNLAQLVAYSTITANFRAAVPEVPRPRHTANRFPWLDRVGPEPMLGDF